jgi:N-acetylglucosaminyldiphosphoundecaprenol N-acetyl-beta-D-mannosaminyltransferase
MRKSLIILGVPVDDITMKEALDRIEQFVAIGRATGKTHQIATVNADFVVNALHDPELCFILQQADMATPDGTPLVLGARLLGVPLSGRVTGADMVPALAELSAQKGYSMFFLGAAPGVAERAAAILQERYPGLNVIGTLSPPKSSVIEMDRSLVDHLNQLRPDILLVAFGNPKQEKWISMVAKELHGPVCIGIGGTLDMITGEVKRAPVWMQRSGLEWLFRLVQEPRRLWKRYVKDLFYFSLFFARQWWAMKRDPKHAPLMMAELVDTAESIDANELRVIGRLVVNNVAEFVQQAEIALLQRPFLAINLSEATFLDSSALGALVNLANRAQAAGGTLWLVAVPPPIMHVLQLVKLDRFFEIHTTFSQAVARRPAQNALPVIEASTVATGWAVVKMPRMVDASSASNVVGQCDEVLAQNPRLVLDFSETVLLSSAGLAAMVKLNRKSRERGGELRVASANHDVTHGIKLVRLDSVVPLYQDVQSAITSTLPKT